MMATPYPMEIIQLPEQKRIVMMFEGATHVWREIYMDGRPHPKGDELNPTYLGHSVGHWEGDTLVVDVVGFNESTWMDYFGHPHTDMLHVVEKFSRPNKNTLHYEATFDDPGAYTKPFTVRWNINWNADRRAHGVHLPGEQQIPAAAHRRFRPADLRQETLTQLIPDDLEVALPGALRPRAGQDALVRADVRERAVDHEVHRCA